VSQDSGDGRIAGGQVTVVWDSFEVLDNGSQLQSDRLPLGGVGTSVAPDKPLPIPIDDFVNEVQTATVTYTTPATAADTFTLTFDGATTNPLPANATAAAVQTELNNLATIGGAVGGNVTVTANTTTVNGTATTVYTITFGGTLAGTDVNQITGAGAGTAQVTTATTTDGKSVTKVDFTVNITDGRFIDLRDLDVRLALQHANTEQLRI